MDPNIAAASLEKYQTLNEIGRGAFSVVCKAENTQTGEIVAIKSIPKRYISRQGWTNLTREIEIMLHLNHPNILKLKEFIDTDSHVLLVLEHMEGGELFEQIVQRGSFGEKDASKIVCQILNGIGYLHEIGVAHRDLKPENLLCSADMSRVVVADFGLAKIFGRGELLKTHCGTPSYAAPEILRGDQTYDKSVDLWSIGVITYVLLCGFFPFYGEDPELLRQKIISCDYSFPSPYWDGISEYAKDFIRHLLQVQPSQRWTTEQCLQHPWILCNSPSISNNINLRVSMETFQSNRKLRESDIMQCV